MVSISDNQVFYYSKDAFLTHADISFHLNYSFLIKTEIELQEYMFSQRCYILTGILILQLNRGINDLVQRYCSLYQFIPLLNSFSLYRSDTIIFHEQWQNHLKRYNHSKKFRESLNYYFTVM